MSDTPITDSNALDPFTCVSTYVDSQNMTRVDKEYVPARIARDLETKLNVFLDAPQKEKFAKWYTKHFKAPPNWAGFGDHYALTWDSWTAWKAAVKSNEKNIS